MKQLWTCLTLALASAASAATVTVYPYDGARLLAGQRFDLRVEVSGLNAGETPEVTLDGQPLRGLTQTSSGAGKAELTGRDRSLSAGSHTLTVRSGNTLRQVRWTAEGYARPARAPKNVILFIGDGMGWNTLNAAKLVAAGYDPRNGLPRGTLAIEADPDGSATVTTSSYDSFIVDSANSASSISTGQKVQVNALNVYPDNTEDTLDNPRAETITELLRRTRGVSIGLVTNTFGTDATPAAFAAHTRRRSDYSAIADQYFQGAAKPDVLLFGGSKDFIPQSAPGSRRKDNTDWISASQKLGFQFVSTRTELLKANGNRLFGLFHIDNFPSYLDRAVWQRPEMLGEFKDMPYLWEMTQKAVETLEKNPQGFFLMVEAGMIDKYEHPLDWTRAVWDVLELDKAVAWAKNYAKTHGDTLVVVTADHAHSFSVYGGFDTSKAASGREAVGTYEKAGFPTYGEGRDRNGFPLPATSNALAAGFAATPDYCETYQSREVFKEPTVKQGDVYVANPEICQEPGAFARTGTLPKGASNGVHSADPVPLFAFGPGGNLFRNQIDQTEVFFILARALGLNPEREQR
ncbi:MAG: alkaline phosphatase [Deinococcota bacterium]